MSTHQRGGTRAYDGDFFHKNIDNGNDALLLDNGDKYRCNDAKMATATHTKTNPKQSLKDAFGRQFKYLRFSVTDICNFKCQYCLPEGYCKEEFKQKELSLLEIKNLFILFAGAGFKKIRLTGGEPTARKDLLRIIELAKSTPGIETVALTTNGWNLKQNFQNWKNAGLDAINISIDSLQTDRFQKITGYDKLHEILDGCDRALASGFKKIKFNSVLLKNINDDELFDFAQYVKNRKIDVRFIELMQTGTNTEYFIRHHINAAIYKTKLIENGWTLMPRGETDGPADNYTHTQFEGRLGFIAPYADHFCETCNRLRVSSEGKLRLCLFGNEHYSLRDFLKDQEQKNQAIEKLNELIGAKLQTHYLKEGHYGRTQNFSEIGG